MKDRKNAVAFVIAVVIRTRNITCKIKVVNVNTALLLMVKLVKI